MPSRHRAPLTLPHLSGVGPVGLARVSVRTRCTCHEKNRRVTDVYRVCMLVTVGYVRIFASGRAPHTPVVVWSAKNRAWQRSS